MRVNTNIFYTQEYITKTTVTQIHSVNWYSL